MKYLLHVFGCQMNEADAEVLAGHLEKLGYAKALSEEEADVILLITCCVREHAESRVYGKIGELYHLKQLKPTLILGVCGCMTQQDDVAEKMRTRYPYLDLIFGTHNLPEFPRLLEQARASGELVFEVLPEAEGVVEDLPRLRNDGLKSWVTIMYGCNNYCTYCIVPYVRGRERSRQPHAIVNEITDLVKRGYREITLLGQNVNSYGKDLDIDVDFASLLEQIDQIEGLERIRYMTSHPRDFTERLVDAIASSESVCEQFHLPVQSGSNNMLKAMNRGYTREHYLSLVRKIREVLPNASISTDFIVGFPGETEQDFEDTLSLVKEVRYDSAYTFSYSARTGTPAAGLEDQLSEGEKSERLGRLIEAVTATTFERNLPLQHQVLEVLVEGPSKKDPSKLTGRTRTNKLVHFVGEKELVGKLVDVKITKVQTWSLIGEQAGLPH
ncbi:MAG: bifunctional enzyme involved in thiolation and methylation of tRNA [Bacillota bacterium]|nr:MAG: bifunctional enzyme involved in thiolation and methylation of tRNA [Bacillota bacterium]MBS3949638.1 tRNA (N6-isopentenyl adenosine(37)-C2)-methylthiotransferase MiaB [Peptococcaceae bacterium]